MALSNKSSRGFGVKFCFEYKENELFFGEEAAWVGAEGEVSVKNDVLGKLLRAMVKR